MTLDGISPRPVDSVRTDLTLTINRKGELSAKIVEKGNEEGHKATAEITIVRPKQFDEDAIAKMKVEIDEIIKINGFEPHHTKKTKRVMISYDANPFAYNIFETRADESDDEHLILDEQ